MGEKIIKMRNLLKFTILLVGTNLFSQEKLRVEYVVTPYFESVTKDAFEISPSTTLFELLIEKNESYYGVVPKINNEQIENALGMISASFAVDANPVLKNTEEKTYQEEAKIAHQTFLIKDKLPEIHWEITQDAKEIAGFPVFKATAILADEYPTEVIAWYSPKLNFKTGPDKFWGLPGVILSIETQVNYDDGNKEGIRYLATKVEAVSSKIDHQFPKKAKIVTRQEFAERQEKFLQQQMEMLNQGID